MQDIFFSMVMFQRGHMHLKLNPGFWTKIRVSVKINNIAIKAHIHFFWWYLENIRYDFNEDNNNIVIKNTCSKYSTICI